MSLAVGAVICVPSVSVFPWGNALRHISGGGLALAWHSDVYGHSYRAASLPSGQPSSRIGV